MDLLNQSGFIFALLVISQVADGLTTSRGIDKEGLTEVNKFLVKIGNMIGEPGLSGREVLGIKLLFLIIASYALIPNRYIETSTYLYALYGVTIATFLVAVNNYKLLKKAQHNRKNKEGTENDAT